MTVVGAHPGAAARRGATISPLLVVLCALGALSIAALVLEPRIILGQRGSPPSNPVPAGHEEHQRLIERLAELIEHSVGVLGLHHRGAAPYEEIVLWLHDVAPASPGRPVEREIAILSHSLVMRTITLYRIVGPGEPAGRTAATLGSLAFCEMLRADRRSGAVVLASGVSDMRVEAVGQTPRAREAQSEQGDLRRLRLTLTWPADSADGPDEASVLVNTVLFSSPPE
jgi:hypothetical protein